ncbi:MAG TPA: hypothetical protein PK402_02340 [Tepidisphaeraceae bacterium]|nr:hypothetical protein [Tepidisphaeraceae bacterium]
MAIVALPVFLALRQPPSTSSPSTEPAFATEPTLSTPNSPPYDLETNNNRIRLEGLIIDEHEQPVAGAEITYRVETKYPLPRRVIDYAPARTAISKSDGRFTIDEPGIYLLILDVRTEDRWWLRDYGDQFKRPNELATFNNVYSSLPPWQHVPDENNPAIYPVVPLDFQGEIRMSRGGKDITEDGTEITYKPAFALFPSIGPRFKKIRKIMDAWNQKTMPYDIEVVRQLRDELIRNETSSTQPATAPVN